jgi:hypothetical protein
MTTVHDERLLLQEVRRIYLATSTQPGAAEEYLRAISGGVDDLLAYLHSHAKDAWATTPAGSVEEKQLLDTLEALAEEGRQFGKKERKGKL